MMLLCFQDNPVLRKLWGLMLLPGFGCFSNWLSVIRWALGLACPEMKEECGTFFVVAHSSLTHYLRRKKEYACPGDGGRRKVWHSFVVAHSSPIHYLRKKKECACPRDEGRKRVWHLCVVAHSPLFINSHLSSVSLSTARERGRVLQREWDTIEKERENLLQYTRAGSRSQRNASFSFFEGKLGARKRRRWSLSDIWHLQRSAPHILYADRSVLIKWFDIRRIIWTSLPMERSARWSLTWVLIIERSADRRGGKTRSICSIPEQIQRTKKHKSWCHSSNSILEPGVLLILQDLEYWP